MNTPAVQTHRLGCPLSAKKKKGVHGEQGTHVPTNRREDRKDRGTRRCQRSHPKDCTPARGQPNDRKDVTNSNTKLTGPAGRVNTTACTPEPGGERHHSRG